jgi:hypothetical protein
MRNPIGPDAPKDSTPVDPDADIHNYPPAVLKEADAAARAAFEAAMSTNEGAPLDIRRRHAEQQAAEAAAAVLARHVVAVRLDALNSGVVLTRGDSTDAEMRERGKAAAREASRAPFSTSSEPGQFAVELARFAPEQSAAGPAFVFDEKLAGQFTVQPSASTSFTIGPPPLVGKVAALVDRYLKAAGEAAAYVAADGRPLEAVSLLARLRADLVALVTAREPPMPATGDDTSPASAIVRLQAGCRSCGEHPEILREATERRARAEVQP